jgi:hypothetical protein
MKRQKINPKKLWKFIRKFKGKDHLKSKNLFEKLNGFW